MATDAAPGEERIRVRRCRRRDRAALSRLGHPPDVVRLLCPSPLARLVWAATGTVARGLLAEEAGPGGVCGSIHLVRSRLDRGTFIFGHWRVATGRRREGIGRRLLAGALAAIPQARRLYSLVERGNEASLRAHRQLGFEPASELMGRAELGALSTIGPPAPAVRFEPAARGARAPLFRIYARATGELWLRLFPSLGPDGFLGRGDDPALPGPSRFAAIGEGARRVQAVYARDALVGFVVSGRAGLGFCGDPAACDAGILARVALQAIDRGTGRRATIGLRGASPALYDRPGPIAWRVLMGLADTAALARDPGGQ